MSEEKIIVMTLRQLNLLLQDQKKVVGEYMTRNLSVYGDVWHQVENLKELKDNMRKEALKSPDSDDLIVLKKYLKP